MKVLIAGASGLLGTALSESLISDGHIVSRLVRKPPAQPGDIEWHPERGELDPRALTGVDVAVCLSGSPVQRRRTAASKDEVRTSRVTSTRTLAEAMAAADTGPRILIAGSAVGYYGDTGDREVDESSPAGETFLAGVCVDWEAASAPASEGGIRVVNVRTGLVLSPSGGLIGRLKPIVWLGAGGRLGSGRQFYPWISITDEIHAMRFAIDTPTVSGPLNLTAPTPVRNAEFIAALARAMHRPALVPTPAVALKLVLGEFAEDVLTGQRAVPTKLTEAGYPFRHPTLESVLRDVAG